jgi:3-deoxy-D-manno-octulosonate 8-phosphate phosphatase (KDO 8-P phosphatase)
MNKKPKVNFAEIKLLVMDVDGVLTDGTIVVNGDGSESKSFNSLDGHGIRMFQRAELTIAILSGRNSEPVNHRARELGIEYVFQNQRDKLPTLKNLLEELGLSSSQAAFIGDDLPDIPPMRYVGFGAAVANAAEEVKQNADYITIRSGGSGAVREVIELILRNGGKWDELMKRYIP